MTITATALQNLQSHWALSAIPEEERTRATELVNERLVQQATGRQTTSTFTEDEADDVMLDRVALAYEMAAIEGLSDLSHPDGSDNGLRGQAAAASHHVFDFRRLAPIPENAEERIFHVLELAAVAYCGDRRSDMQRWFTENKAATAVPTVADTPWDRRLLYRLFECWVYLFSKDSWDDLDRIREIIAGLREDQRSHEKACLSTGSAVEKQAVALRLISLYHWATATEILTEYLQQGQSRTVFGDLDKHFESSMKAVTASGDARHEMILRWLRAAGGIMVTNSPWY